MMVRRSHMAMDRRTVLVGELMLGLMAKYTIFVIFSKTYLPAQDNDNETVREEGDAYEDRHDEAIDYCNNIQRTQPGGSIY